MQCQSTWQFHEWYHLNTSDLNMASLNSLIQATWTLEMKGKLRWMILCMHLVGTKVTVTSIPLVCWKNGSKGHLRISQQFNNLVQSLTNRSLLIQVVEKLCLFSTVVIFVLRSVPCSLLMSRRFHLHWCIYTLLGCSLCRNFEVIKLTFNH